MANNYSKIQELSNKNNMGLSNTIKRDYGMPLDHSSVHETYEAALNYAQNSTLAYIGQPISVGDTLYVVTDAEHGYLKQVGTGVASSATQVQADMAQNDSTQPDYIKNRIAYDTRETSKYIHSSEAPVVSFEITDLGQTYIKISNLLPDKDSFSSVFLSFNGNDPISFNSANILLDTPDINTLGFPFGELIICRQSGDLSINIDDFSLSFNVPEEGIYILSNSEKPIPEGTSYEITIGELKTIEDKYLPDSIPRLDDSGKIKREQLPNDLNAGSSGVGSSSVQSDYEQNDSTQSDFIKNRPFYDNRVDIHYSYEENPNPVSFDCPPVGYSFYKISDRVLTKDEVFASKFIVNGREIDKFAENDVLIETNELLIVQDKSVGNGYGFCVCYTTGTCPFTYGESSLSVEVPKVGTYRIYNLGAGMSNISTIDITSKEGLKQIEEKYIPDSLKLGWVEPPIFSAKWSPSVFQSIIWDGDTSSRASFLLMDESSGADGTLRYYKVSDQVLTYQDLEDCCLGFKNPDSDEVEYGVLGYDDLEDNILYRDDDTILTSYFVSASKPTTVTIDVDSEITTIKIPYPGTYFLHMKSGNEAAYLTALSGRIETTYEDVDIYLFTEDGAHICCQHVSDEVLKKESMIGAKITLCSEEEGYIQCYQSVVDSQETLDSIFMDFGNGGYGIGDGIPYILFTPKDNWEFVVPDAGISYIFPKAGTYFLYMEADDGSGREYVEEFGFDEIVHKIDPKFIDLSGVSVSSAPSAPSGGSTTKSVGVPVLPTGRIIKLSEKYYIRNYEGAAASRNFSDYAYKDVPNEFIIAFEYTGSIINSNNYITLEITTGVDGHGQPNAGISIVTDLRYLCPTYYIINVRKQSDGTYKAETILNASTDIDGGYENQLVTIRAIRDKLSSSGIGSVDEVPTENSRYLVKSGGVYQAIEDAKTEVVSKLSPDIVQSDMNEQNPESLAYVRNKLVYNEPLHPHNYDAYNAFGRGSSYPYLTSDIQFERNLLYYNIYESKGYKVNILDIAKISTSKGYLSQADVRLEVYGDPTSTEYNASWGYAIYDAEGKIPYPLIVSPHRYATFSGITFDNSAHFFLLLDANLETSEVISEIIYKTRPHKLPSEYLDMDEVPTEESGNPITSGAVFDALKSVSFETDDTPTEGSTKPITSAAVFTALKTVQDVLDFEAVPTEGSNKLINSGAIYTALETDDKPIANSKKLMTSGGIYKALVVGDKPLFEPLTPGNSYTTTAYKTSSSHVYLAGKYHTVYYEYIGYPSEEFLNKRVEESLNLIQSIGISYSGGDLLASEPLEVIAEATRGYIQGLNNYKFPLIYLVTSTININGTKVQYPGFYVATWDIYKVDTIVYKEVPCKLPNQYLNIDDAITENSENPVSSGTVFTALKDVQNNLQFDDTPTQDSEKLVKSGALYTAFADVQKSLEVDDIPLADSEKLIKSGGVHKVISELETKIYTKAEIDGKISGVYHYKGSVEYYKDLPTEGNKIGDAYNIKNDSFDSNNKLIARAGDNVVYYEVNVLSVDDNGEEIIVPIGFWDVLAGIVDLSSYALKTELPTKLSQLINDGNYLTETDNELYVITEENKNEEVPEHATVILDTTITEEAEFVDLSEFMRNVPVTEEDNGKYLRVQEGKWAAGVLNAITHDPQRLSLYEQAQARKNINAAEVWTISKTVDQVSSINGFDELSIIRKTSPDIQSGLVRVCENIYSLDDLVGVKVNVYLNDGTSSEHIIEKDEISVLTDNNTLLWSARDLEFNGVTYQLNCLIIAPEDIEIPIFDDLVQKQILSGTYLSFIKLGTGSIHMTMDITAKISLPMSSDYLEQFLTKSLLAQPLGLATLTENGQIPLEQLPADIGVQADWNEFNEKSRAFLKNKPFGDIRYANSIFWDGDVSKCQVSSEVNLLPFVGQDISAVYVKISELETYNQTRPAILNQDIESLYWSTQSNSEITHIALDSTTITYDAGDDGSTVCARLSVDKGVPIIYFVEHYTSKNFTTDSLITFPSAGIYVLYLKDIGFVTQLHWKTASVKSIDERFLPSAFKLPEITAEDEGKVLKVVDGKACWVSLDS